MAGNKELRIEGKFDSSSLKNLQRSLKEVEGSTNTLNKSLSLLNNQFAAIGKSIDRSAKILPSFSKGLQSIGQDVGKQIKGLEQYTKILERLNKALAPHGRGVGQSSSTTSSSGTPFSYVGPSALASAGRGGGFGGGGSPGNPLFVAIVGGGGPGGQGPGGQGPGGQLVPAPGGGFAIVPPGGQGQTPAQAQQLQALTLLGRGIQQLASVGVQSANFIQEMKTAPFESMAAARGTRGGMARRMMGGDLTDVLALQNMQRTNVSALGEFGGRGAARAGNVLNAIGGVGSGITTGTGAGVAAGGLNAVGGAFGFEARGGAQKIEAETIQKGLELSKQMDPVQTAIFQNFMSNTPAILQANRRLGGGAIRAAGMGVGVGMMPGEAMQFFTGGANQFGTAAMMGRNSGKQGWVPPTFAPLPAGTPLISDVQQEPLTPGRWERRAGPGDFEGIGARALKLQRKGFDKDLMTQLLGGLQAGMGGGIGTRLNESQRILTEAMATGVKQGFSDVQTLENLGSTIAEAAIAPSIFQTGGAISGAGLAAALSSGLAPGAAPQLIGERFQGMQALGQATQQNPFLFNRSMARARGILGGEAEVAQTAALGRATPAELLMGGKGGMAAGDLGVLGITSTQAKEQFTENTRDIIRRAATSSKRLRDMIAAAGGDELQALAGPGGREARELTTAVLRPTTAGFQNRRDTLRGLEGAVAAARGETGVLDKEAQTLMGGLKDQGGMALGAAQSQAGVQLKALTEAFTPTNVEMFTKVFKSTGDVFDVLKGMQSGGIEDSVKVMQALEHLIIVLNSTDEQKVKAIADKIEKRVRGK